MAAKIQRTVARCRGARRRGAWLALSCAALVVRATAAPLEPPPWAFAINPPGGDAQPSGAAERRYRVPGSASAYTRAEVSDLFTVADWHPDDHPPAPGVVTRGRLPQLWACGFCHLPNGQGRPENASLAGLPVAYIVRQVGEFASGQRRSADPAHRPSAMMGDEAMAVSPAELEAAAAYFASLRRRSWIRVVESAQVPRMRVAGWMLVPDAAGGTEPIGARIVETPENVEYTELRDDESGFVAYVPPGSIARGQALASGGGGLPACAGCHGTRLRGAGDIPPLAGRSPSYLVRQLVNFNRGARAGALAVLMQPVAASLSVDDMVALAAYAASLPP